MTVLLEQCLRRHMRVADGGNTRECTNTIILYAVLGVISLAIVLLAVAALRGKDRSVVEVVAAWGWCAAATLCIRTFYELRFNRRSLFSFQASISPLPTEGAPAKECIR